MKLLSKTIAIFLLFLVLHPANAQVNEGLLAGSWLGTLDAGGVQLRVIFNISVGEEGELVTTLDSPDQGASGIALGETVQWGDSIRIEAPMLLGRYLGKVNSETSMQGVWTQGGNNFELNLEKQKEAFRLNRPQEPQPPFPYGEEEVIIENVTQGFALGGTFTIPAGEGPFPGVVLVSGSGSQNRDEEIFGHKPFKLIADQLARNGIAVLRYDDRGMGASGGNPAGSTTADNAGDARSAIDYLMKRDEIDHSKTGIIGHSEGGLIAFMLASAHDDIAFVISLAGPGVDGKTILLEQSEYISRLSGVDESVREDNRIVMSRIYDLMISHESREEWSVKEQEFTNEYYSGLENSEYTEEVIERINNNILSSIPASAYPWMRFFVMSDPSSYLGSVRCPVLALNGEKDCQVLPEKNIGAIRERLQESGNQNVTTQILPGLNHLFQNCETGLPAEYGVIEETFDPHTLELIREWIVSL